MKITWDKNDPRQIIFLTNKQEIQRFTGTQMNIDANMKIFLIGDISLASMATYLLNP